MPSITQICRITGKKFEVNQWEQEFLKKFELPLPTLCIEERHRRRLSHRNERKIYKTKCDLTGKDIISIYNPEKRFGSANKRLKIYSQEAWWGDNWDPKQYGRPYDFTKTFFEQFNELRYEVPRLSLLNTKGENSEYCNLTTSNKNCYLVFGGDFNEDCRYSLFSMHCKDTADVYWVNKSELVYDSINCLNSYNLKYCQSVYNCRDSAFLFECRNLENCFGCINLNNKKFHIFNKPYSKEEYEKKLKEFNLSSYQNVQKLKKEFDEFKLKFPHKYGNLINTENCDGNEITNAKNCHNCYYIEGLAEDLKDIYLGGWGLKDTFSCDHIGHGNTELCYELMSSIGGYNCVLSSFAWNSQDIFYCDMVVSSNNLFGCTNMKRAEYCILNKQYTKEEYFDLRKQIIEQMKKNNEFGEFFPIENSLFDYNETVANDWFPLLKEEANQKGYKWHEEEKKEPGIGEQIPDSINNVTDEILQKTLICEKTGRPYRIIPSELKYYKQMQIPIPHLAPETRNELRIKMLNPIFSWDRTCAKCDAKIKTTYSPDRPETVYCEKCYLKAVY